MAGQSSAELSQELRRITFEQQYWPDDQPLRSYLEARVADLNVWLRRLADLFPAPQMLLLHESLGVRTLQPRQPTIGGPPWLVLARVGAHVLDHEFRTKTFEADFRQTGIRAVSLPASYPKMDGPDELVRFTSRAVEQGVEYFEFEALEEFPPDVVTWAKQAVRYARRQSEGR
jgi:hypothetical protein